MQDAFLDYSMSVIVQRALPDVRDGLKPVHRRILYAMHGLGLGPLSAHKKSATVVGEVLGKYHPHGDAAVYEALVRMVRSFSLRYPLVDGQGNFGSIDGDAAAAYRYTEARLSAFASELLSEIEKETVDWTPNFDDRLKEPTVLPSRHPNLLVNGSSGIAVGMSTNVPPHNLREVVSALGALFANPECTTEEILSRIPGPDFPTGGFIVGRQGIRKMAETGRGRITMRARVVREKLRGGLERLVVTELPYAVQKSRIVAQITRLSRAGALADVADIKDESDRDGLRFIVELKRGADALDTLKTLFRRTSLQSTFGAILLALDKGTQPKIFTLKQLLERFRDHRVEVVKRRARFDHEKAEIDLEVVLGLLRALDSIDEVVAIVRTSRSRPEASGRLQAELGLTALQAGAVLDMRLGRLTGLEHEELRASEADLRKTVRTLGALLASEKRQLEFVRKELTELARTYGDARRTTIIGRKAAIAMNEVKDSVADEDVVLVFSYRGHVKRIPVHIYRKRLDDGIPLADMSRFPGDYLQRVSLARTGGRVVAFSRLGRAHVFEVDDVPERVVASRGPRIGLLADGAPKNDRIVAAEVIDDSEASGYFVFLTRQGLVKRTRVSAFWRASSGSGVGIGMGPGDQLASVRRTDGNAELLIASRKGYAIRFPEAAMGTRRPSLRGVRGIQLQDGDGAVSLAVLHGNSVVLTALEDGEAKWTPMEELRRQKRGGKGALIVYRPRGAALAASPGRALVAALGVLDTDLITFVTDQSRLIQLNVDQLPMTTFRDPGRPIPGIGEEKILSASHTFAGQQRTSLSDEGRQAEPDPEPDLFSSGATE